MCNGLSRILTADWPGGFALGGLALAVLIGCGGSPGPGTERSPHAVVPTGLILERTVTGSVLGRPLKTPTGLAADDRGALYVLDSYNQRVVWFSRDLVPLREFFGQGSAAGRLGEPRGLTVDPERHVWISDYAKRLLVQCNSQLEYGMEIEHRDVEDQFQLGRPAGLALTDFGDIWVADPDNHRIVVLDPVGQFEMFVGDAGSPGGQLNEPSDLFVDRHDRIYVCDRGNQRIVVYDDRGGLVQEIRHLVLEAPTAIAVDEFGRIWVLEQHTGRLNCFTNDGHLLTTLGPGIAGADQPLLNPADLVFMPDGRLVISDTGHARLLVCRVTASLSSPSR